MPCCPVPSCAVQCVTPCPWLINTKSRGSDWTESVKVKSAAKLSLTCEIFLIARTADILFGCMVNFLRRCDFNGMQLRQIVFSKSSEC